MAEFEVIKAEKKKTFTGKKGGEYGVWTLSLRDGENFETCELVQAASSPAPSGKIEGTIDKSGEYGAKFVTPKGTGGGFSRGKSPEQLAQEKEIERIRQFSIQAQTAQKNALQALEIKQRDTGLDQPVSALLPPLIAFFWNDLQARVKEGLADA